MKKFKPREEDYDYAIEALIADDSWNISEERREILNYIYEHYPDIFWEAIFWEAYGDRLKHRNRRL